MDKLKSPYSHLDRARNYANAQLREGVEEYQPVQLGWEEYEPLDLGHLTQDDNGRWIQDTSVPRVFLIWDPDRNQWIIDSDKYEVDTTR